MTYYILPPDTPKSKLKDILWNSKLTHSERVEKIKRLKNVEVVL